MKVDITNFGKVLPLVAAGMLAYAGAAYSQTEKRVIEAPKEPGIQLDRVSATAPTVNLTAVAKEVEPGIMEVDPSSVRGKRLVLGTIAGKNICLGKWTIQKRGTTENKFCQGMWIQG